ncbi:MAG: GNAT family N-acetyltransferase [Myxococcaceae bacterium]
MALTVRRLQVVDLPALEKAEAERAKRYSGRAGALAGFRKLVEQTLSKEPEGLMIADQDGQLVGIAIARQRGVHPGSGKRHGRIEHLGVAPGFESAGVGARLLREAEAYLRSRGCESIHLLLPADDAADAQLLKDAGYRVVAWELEKAFR